MFCVPRFASIFAFFSVGTKLFSTLLLFWLVVSLLIAPWPIISFNLHNFSSIYTQWKRSRGKGRNEGTILCCFTLVGRKVVITLEQSSFFLSNSHKKTFLFARQMLRWRKPETCGKLFPRNSRHRCFQVPRVEAIEWRSFYVRNVYLWLWCGVIHMPFRLLRIKFMVKPLI